MKLTSTERIDLVNIGLMIFSFALAIVIPFELFLFSYAILGPLHYLTEISWLHDRQYFTKGKYDAYVLLVVGLLLTIAYFNGVHALGLELPENIFTALTFIALASALIMVLVKNTFYKIAGIALIILTSQVAYHWQLFLGVFLPTLIHVYIFTGLFMLFGALKSKSRFGLLAVAMLVICAVGLFFVFPDMIVVPVTQYGQDAYVGRYTNNIDQTFEIGFMGLHKTTLQHFFNYPADKNGDAAYWLNAVFHSKAGILLARFIAFAYTYHYLNWFSKTEVIRWHKVPKARFAVVILFYLASIGIYIYNYTLGLQWLFFLSFLHVLLEFPLNYTSIIGIGKSIKERFSPSPATQS